MRDANSDPPSERVRHLVGTPAESDAPVSRAAKSHRLHWESPVLAPIGERPISVAEDVAADLGFATGSMRELVQLHLEALDAALAFDAPGLLGDQRTWQSSRLETLRTPFGARGLEAAIRATLFEHLEESGRGSVTGMYDAAAAWRREHPPAVDELALAGPSGLFLEAALQGRRQDAVRLVLDLVRDGASPAEVMLDVLGPAQVRLGGMWERGEVTVAQEHATTVVTQLALSLLYPRVQVAHSESAESVSGPVGTVVATSVGYEAHEIGIRMVSDLMELAGWSATYLGVDVPHQDVIATVRANRADVLAVSATMAGHVAAVRRLIAYLREAPGGDAVRVLVGGRPFALVPGVAARIGADGWAANPHEAMQIAASWLD